MNRISWYYIFNLFRHSAKEPYFMMINRTPASPSGVSKTEKRDEFFHCNYIVLNKINIVGRNIVYPISGLYIVEPKTSEGNYRFVNTASTIRLYSRLSLTAMNLLNNLERPHGMDMVSR